MILQCAHSNQNISRKSYLLKSFACDTAVHTFQAEHFQEILLTFCEASCVTLQCVHSNQNISWKSYLHSSILCGAFRRGVTLLQTSNVTFSLICSRSSTSSATQRCRSIWTPSISTQTSSDESWGNNLSENEIQFTMPSHARRVGSSKSLIRIPGPNRDLAIFPVEQIISKIPSVQANEPTLLTDTLGRGNIDYRVSFSFEFLAKTSEIFLITRYWLDYKTLLYTYFFVS